MGIKEQIIKLKDNWLIFVIALLLILFVLSGGSFFRSFNSIGSSYNNLAMQETSRYAPYDKTNYNYNIPSETDFAPEVKDRKITKTTTMSTEVDRGTFKDSESKLKSIVSSSESFMLNENVNKYGTKIKSYYQGSYQIKVASNKYNSVIMHLKEIGEVQSFNENTLDITGQYTNTNIEIEAEKSRLERYKAMYSEAKEIKDKIELNDRIFEQERRIRYLEDSLKNIDQKIDYSTLYFSMNEKRSDYMNVAFVKFSELVSNLVSSTNGLFKLAVVLIPWVIALFVIKLFWGIFKRR